MMRYAVKRPSSLLSLLSIVFSFIVMVTLSSKALAKNENVLRLAYITQPGKTLATLSNSVRRPTDSGLQGALLGVSDSNTTGKFIGQKIQLTSMIVNSQQALTETLDNEYKMGVSVYLLNVPLNSLHHAQTWATDKPVVIYNINNQQDDLRKQHCDANTFHTIASHSMKNDALAQWLLSKRLTKVLVVSGRHPEDLAIAQSFKRSAKRYGLKILAEKQWKFDADLRRSASREMPLFTQTSKEYDVVFVSDHIKDFAEYLPYNTYLPRPVVGSAGLEALAWHPRIEQWGATQLQNRFIRQAKRAMNEIDFAGYLAVRSISLAFSQVNSDNNGALKHYLRSDKFALAAYVGRKLTFRHWNQQLRMPIALLQPNALISQSPQVGILHPTNVLDTLGFDQGESRCKL